uniref:Uncharacterized protein n=1 Tax=Oncorhynchus mykiss TaxID=8022 RepID=A0A8C7Q3A9_ONCMY
MTWWRDTERDRELQGGVALLCGSTTPLNHVPDGVILGTNVPCWYYFTRPILAILIGGVLFGLGTALSLLYFTQVGNVPYLLGPVFLSAGLMFLVTGLVWVPVVKQRLEHKAPTKVYAKMLTFLHCFVHLFIQSFM